MILEIGCNSYASAKIAYENGADRIELFSDWHSGGCTPSLGTMKACANFDMPIYAMIRPRGGHFNYSDEEFEIMKSDVLACKDANISGIVFGILTSAKEIDQIRCKELLNLWDGPATFHRAFDSVKNPHQSIEILLDLGFERILTSGQKQTAIEGIELIKSLVSQSRKRIHILPGAGINTLNAKEFLNITGIEGIHTTANAILTHEDIAGENESIVDRETVLRLRSIMDEIL
jgi:copper homeostasis protein